MISKYTIVIPTLWKSTRIHTLLKNLIDCECVDEIILIDNNREFYNHYNNLEKVRLIQPSQNIYVNPSWNWGVVLSKNNLVALVNDDINFDTNIFSYLTEDKVKENGFIGMDYSNYDIDVNDTTQWDIVETITKPHGWGCFIIFHKENWIPIPDELKIWYGDNFIVEVNPCKKSKLINFKIETEMSTTSDEPVWNEVKNQDTHYYITNILK